MNLILTDSAKKAMNQKQKKERMAAKKELWAKQTFSSSLACPLHGFLCIDCIQCMTNLKKRLKQGVAPKPPEE